MYRLNVTFFELGSFFGLLGFAIIIVALLLYQIFRAKEWYSDNLRKIAGLMIICIIGCGALSVIESMYFFLQCYRELSG